MPVSIILFYLYVCIQYPVSVYLHRVSSSICMSVSSILYPLGSVCLYPVSPSICICIFSNLKYLYVCIQFSLVTYVCIQYTLVSVCVCPVFNNCMSVSSILVSVFLYPVSFSICMSLSSIP